MDSSAPEARSAASRLDREYRNLARTLHPDKGGTPDEFHRLRDAYEDAKRRGATSLFAPVPGAMPTAPVPGALYDVEIPYAMIGFAAALMLIAILCRIEVLFVALGLFLIAFDWFQPA